MPHAPRSPRQTRIADNLLRLARKLLAEDANDLDELCVGRTQLALVFLVIDAPGICMAAVANRLRIDKSAVTRAVKRLELVGYVERRRSRRDRRMWELHPTKGSDRLAWIVRPSDTSPEARMFAGFGDDDLRRLDEYLYRMVENLKVTRAMAEYRAVRGSNPPPFFND